MGRRVSLALIDKVRLVTDVLVALGIVFVWRQALLLKTQIKLTRDQIANDHQRSRRELAIRLMNDWNKGVTPEMAAAERLVKDLTLEQCRQILDGTPLELSAAKLSLARACLVGCGSELGPAAEGDTLTLSETHLIRLRFLLTDYLNLMEATLAAWHLKVADQRSMEQQFLFLFASNDGSHALDNYSIALGGQRLFPATYAFKGAVVGSRPVHGTPGAFR